MKCTTSWASAASNVSFGSGSRSAVGAMHLNSGMSPPDGFHEGFRRIDGDNRVLAQSLDQLGGERAGTTSDVDRPLPGRDADEVREHGGERAGVPTHEPVVGVRRDGKPHERESILPVSAVTAGHAARAWPAVRHSAVWTSGPICR